MLDSTVDLLEEEDRAILEKTLSNKGYMSIQSVREAIFTDYKSDLEKIDDDVLLWIDTHINYPLFITKDYIYTREELLSKFPFESFATEPEQVFVQQKFVMSYTKLGSIVVGEPSYHDIDDENVDSVKDQILSENRRNHKTENCERKEAKSNIYIGKDDWKNFKLMKRLVKGMQKFLAIEGDFMQATRATALLLGGPEKKEVVEDIVIENVEDDLVLHIPELNL